MFYYFPSVSNNLSVNSTCKRFTAVIVRIIKSTTDFQFVVRLNSCNKIYEELQLFLKFFFVFFSVNAILIVFFRTYNQLLDKTNEKKIIPQQGQFVLYRDEISGHLKRCRVVVKDSRIFECIDSGEKFQSLSSSVFEFPCFEENCFPALAVYVKFGRLPKSSRREELVMF